MTAPVSRFVFGELTVAVQGLGVYFGGPHLQAKCNALSPEALKAANKEAWRQRRAADRAAARVCNISIHGNGSYDRASLHANVAEVVCKETWKRMARAAA